MSEQSQSSHNPSHSMPSDAAQQVRTYLEGLQKKLCEFLEGTDGVTRCVDDPIYSPKGGVSQPRVFSDGEHIERGAAQFTHSIGDHLPAAASKTRPHIAGWAFQAVSLSWIFHPRNPYAPTTHGNLRFFCAQQGDQSVWWFGGGFDLTPYYGFKEDAMHWHQMAHDAVTPFGDDLYERFKKQCDDYFYLPHRKEARGIGGLFFDDWTGQGFDDAFAMIRSIGDHFMKAYLPIYQRRYQMPYQEAQKAFQLYRRGRYVEFNLLYDRGTKYGLQSGRRIEAVMSSMPPVVNWNYQYQAAAGSAEQELVDFYLTPQNWYDMSQTSK